MADGLQSSDAHDAPLSPIRAVLFGHLFVTGPVVVIMAVGSMPLFLSKNVLWSFASALAGFVIAWLWWSLSVPLWRDWAKRRGADEAETQTIGERTLLIWPKGFFLEKTEIKIRKTTENQR